MTPRPGCHCAMCDEAREKGVPYARRGPSVFVHGPDILFDTPEDIAVSLNESGIDRVRACFYSHWHPDHVMGRRVFEQMNWNLRDSSGNYGVTDIYIPERVEKDMQTKAELDAVRTELVETIHKIESDRARLSKEYEAEKHKADERLRVLEARLQEEKSAGAATAEEIAGLRKTMNNKAGWLPSTPVEFFMWVLAEELRKPSACVVQ